MKTFVIISMFMLSLMLLDSCVSGHKSQTWHPHSPGGGHTYKR